MKPMLAETKTVGDWRVCAVNDDYVTIEWRDPRGSSDSFKSIGKAFRREEIADLQYALSRVDTGAKLGPG